VFIVYFVKLEKYKKKTKQQSQTNILSIGKIQEWRRNNPLPESVLDGGKLHVINIDTGGVCRGGGFIYGHNILSEIIVIGKIQDLSDSH